MACLEDDFEVVSDSTQSLENFLPKSHDFMDTVSGPLGGKMRGNFIPYHFLAKGPLFTSSPSNHEI